MEKNRNIVRLTESQLNNLITESVREALNEGLIGGAMRSAYSNGRYDNDKSYQKGVGAYIKGLGTSKKNYDMWKNAYKDDKKKYSNGEFDGCEPDGEYENWTPKAMHQNYVDVNAENALLNKPGFGGKITRAAAVPLIGAANLAGRIARRFGGKQVSESQMYDELIEMINESSINTKIDRIVSESINKILKNK